MGFAQCWPGALCKGAQCTLELDPAGNCVGHSSTAHGGACDDRETTTSTACALLCQASGKLHVVKWLLPWWGMCRRRESSSTDSQESIAPHRALAARSKGASIHGGVGCPVRRGLLQLCSGVLRLCPKMEQEQSAAEGHSAARPNLPCCRDACGRCHICSCFWEHVYLRGISKENTPFPWLCAGTTSMERENEKQTELLFRELWCKPQHCPMLLAWLRTCRGSCFWWWSSSIYWQPQLNLFSFSPLTLCQCFQSQPAWGKRWSDLLHIPELHLKTLSENEHRLLRGKHPWSSSCGERHGQSKGSWLRSEQCLGGPQCGGTVLETWKQTGSQFMQTNNIHIELSLKVY